MRRTAALFSALALASLAAAPASAGSVGSASLSIQPEGDPQQPAQQPEQAAEAGAAEPTEMSVPAAPSRYGEEGSWWWTVGGLGGASVNNGDASAAAFVGASTFLAEDFEFSLDLTVWYLGEDDPSGDDAAAINFNPKFRWHFISEETHTIFAEAGVGLLLATEEVPESGSEFNFTPQAGFGATFPLSGGPDRLVVGVNWRHFSNANMFGSDRNPGRDDIVAYVAVTFPF